jgi:membrane protein YqaA with SNARE-associated domain
MRVPLPIFLVLVTVAKTARYAATAWAGSAAFGT